MEARKSRRELTTELQNWSDQLHDELKKVGWRTDVIEEAALGIMSILEQEELLDLFDLPPSSEENQGGT